MVRTPTLSRQGSIADKSASAAPRYSVRIAASTSGPATARRVRPRAPTPSAPPVPAPPGKTASRPARHGPSSQELEPPANPERFIDVA